MQDTIERDGLRHAIEKALRFSYTSRSCHDAIATGSHYQSVRLGSERLAGFRGDRGKILDMIDLSNRTVLDIGSNLGELSRDALERGAGFVHGLEYDALFVLISDLISVYNGVDRDRYQFDQGDVTKQFQFGKPYDVVLAFSVFTYISRRIAEIARVTKEVLVLETHNIEQGWEGAYVKPLLPYFPVILLLTESDWGTEQQFSEGKRYVLCCFKNHTLAWQVIQRIETLRPELTTGKSCVLEQSRIPALEGLKRVISTGRLDAARKLSLDRFAFAAFARPLPSDLSNETYWIDFFRGFEQFQAHGNVLSADNIYVRLLQAMIASGGNFDPGAVEQMKNADGLHARVTSRFRNMNRIATGDAALADTDAVVLFDVDGHAGNFHVVDDTGTSYAGTALDGYHRMAAAVLLGRRTIPLYVLNAYGSLT